MANRLHFLCVAFLLLLSARPVSQAQAPTAGREHLLLDFGWHFAYGHPSDPKQEFNTGTGYFSYLAKTGYGDGAVVEQGFSEKASFSHGFKTVGRAFPNTNVGWYRKSFAMLATDLGQRISLEYDGVYRNSIVWVNEHYLGTQASGYNGFEYNITDYLNYSGTNIMAVRVDATIEEGWSYEGAVIYRHPWLTKTTPLHVAPHGTFVTTKLDGNASTLTAKATIKNSALTPQIIDVVQDVVDAPGRTVVTAQVRQLHLGAAQIRAGAVRPRYTNTTPLPSSFPLPSPT